MDKSLIEKAREIAKQKKEDDKIKHEEHMNSIYCEAMRLLEQQIQDEKVTSNGDVYVRTSHYFYSSFLEGYCGWNRDIFVWRHEGVEIAKRISMTEGIKCDYEGGIGSDGYFRFNIMD